MTLTELLVVVAVMAVLLSISVPTAQHLMEGFESSTGVRHLINAALSNARAIAVRGEKDVEHGYAGVRFQEDVNGNSYMIFIIHDNINTGLANGARAVVGRKPMKLPEDIGILGNIFSPSNGDAYNNALLDTEMELTNARTFSIAFTKMGKLTMHPVRVRNKDGFTESTDPGDGTNNDTIFNTEPVEKAGTAMFYQDDYPSLGYDQEDSVHSVIIYSKKEFAAVPAGERWSGYLKNIKPSYISPYTGELVMEYNDENP